MSVPAFLSVPIVEALHQRAIERYGGTLGVRDRSGLEAAVNHPQNVYFYGGGDLFDLAVAYAFHIAQAQAFLDGNKRTAVATALVFLELNGQTKRVDEHPIYEAMIAIAERRLNKADMAALFRKLFAV